MENCECGAKLSPKVIDWCKSKGKKVLCYDCQRKMDAPEKGEWKGTKPAGGLSEDFLRDFFKTKGSASERRTDIECGQDINNTHEFLAWFLGKQLDKASKGQVDEKLYREAFTYWFPVISDLNGWARKHKKQ